MKAAFYIEDGLEQIVLTPETDVERMVLGKMNTEERTMQIEHGSFYPCRGGWVRHGENDTSTIIILRAVVCRPGPENDADPATQAILRDQGRG